MKISTASKKDFEFFLNTDLDMIGVNVGIDDFRDDPNGCSALECWFQRDTHGKILPCREIEALKKAERGKQSWNLQIKMWAEDVAQMSGHIIYQPLGQEELYEYCHGCPTWVFDATMKFAHLMSLRKLVDDPEAEFIKGYEKRRLGPRFARLEKVLGNFWPPHMDRFDACI